MPSQTREVDRQGIRPDLEPKWIFSKDSLAGPAGSLSPVGFDSLVGQWLGLSGTLLGAMEISAR